MSVNNEYSNCLASEVQSVVTAEQTFAAEDICTGRALAAHMGAGGIAMGEFVCQFKSLSAQPGEICCSVLVAGPEILRRSTPERRCLKTRDARTDAQQTSNDGQSYGSAA